MSMEVEPLDCDSDIDMDFSFLFEYGDNAEAASGKHDDYLSLQIDKEKIESDKFFEKNGFTAYQYQIGTDKVEVEEYEEWISSTTPSSSDSLDWRDRHSKVMGHKKEVLPGMLRAKGMLPQEGEPLLPVFMTYMQSLIYSGFAQHVGSADLPITPELWQEFLFAVRTCGRLKATPGKLKDLISMRETSYRVNIPLLKQVLHKIQPWSPHADKAGRDQMLENLSSFFVEFNTWGRQLFVKNKSVLSIDDDKMMTAADPKRENIKLYTSSFGDNKIGICLTLVVDIVSGLVLSIIPMGVGSTGTMAIKRACMTITGCHGFDAINASHGLTIAIDRGYLTNAEFLNQLRSSGVKVIGTFKNYHASFNKQAPFSMIKRDYATTKACGAKANDAALFPATARSKDEKHRLPQPKPPPVVTVEDTPSLILDAPPFNSSSSSSSSPLHSSSSSSFPSSSSPSSSSSSSSPPSSSVDAHAGAAGSGRYPSRKREVSAKQLEAQEVAAALKAKAMEKAKARVSKTKTSIAKKPKGAARSKGSKAKASTGKGPKRKTNSATDDGAEGQTASVKKTKPVKCGIHKVTPEVRQQLALTLKTNSFVNFRESLTLNPGSNAMHIYATPVYLFKKNGDAVENAKYSLSLAKFKDPVSRTDTFGSGACSIAASIMRNSSASVQIAWNEMPAIRSDLYVVKEKGLGEPFADFAANHIKVNSLVCWTRFQGSLAWFKLRPGLVTSTFANKLMDSCGKVKKYDQDQLMQMAHAKGRGVLQKKNGT